MSEELDDWTYDPERDDPWLDEAVAAMDRGEWITHEEAMRRIGAAIAEELATHAARRRVGR
jgi:hypothetical protein